MGGVALQLQGSSYATFDLDLAYDRSRENWARLAAALKAKDIGRGLTELRALREARRLARAADDHEHFDREPNVE